MLKGKFLWLSAYIRKEERSKTNNNLSFLLTKLVKKNKINLSMQNEGNNEDGSRNKTKKIGKEGI